MTLYRITSILCRTVLRSSQDTSYKCMGSEDRWKDAGTDCRRRPPGNGRIYERDWCRYESGRAWCDGGDDSGNRSGNPAHDRGSQNDAPEDIEAVLKKSL